MHRRPFILAGLVLGLWVSCQPPLVPAVAQHTCLALVIDVSASSAIGASETIADQRCPQVWAATEQALATPGLHQLDVLAIATGSKLTAYEGRVIIPWRTFSPTARLFGRKITVQDQQQTFLRELDKQCRSLLRPEAVSPIFFAVERAALSLNDPARQRSSGHAVQVSKTLVVLSDLRETVHTGIRRYEIEVSEALRRGQPVPKRPSRVPVLNLEGIEVRACGLAEHSGGLGSSDDLATILPTSLPLVWQEILGGAVAFDAACRSTSPSLSTAAETKGGAS